VLPVTKTPAPRNSCCTGLSPSPSIAICAHATGSSSLSVLHIQTNLLQRRYMLKVCFYEYFFCACEGKSAAIRKVKSI
jgi:hypothetical protein